MEVRRSTEKQGLLRVRTVSCPEGDVSLRKQNAWKELKDHKIRIKVSYHISNVMIPWRPTRRGRPQRHRSG
jgi:hypothetical protein